MQYIPILLVENAGMIRQAAASTDKVASEVRNHHATFYNALNPDVKQRLLDADKQTQIELKKDGTGE